MHTSLQADPEVVCSRQEVADTSEYHTMASAAELLIKLRDKNRKQKQKRAKEQHSQLEFVDKKTGEIKLHRVVF